MTMLTKAQAAEMFHSSKRTVQENISQIRQLIPQRYPYQSIVISGRHVLVNKYVYIDHLATKNLEEKPKFDITQVKELLQ